MERALSKRVIRRVTSGASNTLYLCLPTVRTESTPELVSWLMARPVATVERRIAAAAESTEKMGQAGNSPRRRSADDPRRTGPARARKSVSSVETALRYLCASWQASRVDSRNTPSHCSAARSRPGSSAGPTCRQALSPPK